MRRIRDCEILDKSVRNLSNSEIDTLVKIRTGNTRAVPITSHSPPTPPILTHSPKPSDPPRPVISLEGIRDSNKVCENMMIILVCAHLSADGSLIYCQHQALLAS